MAKFAERLTILQETNELLLDRLYLARRDMLKNPFFANEKALKFTQQIARSFPEPPQNLEKITGYDIFKTSVEPILTELRKYYETIIDLLEYKELTLELLQEISDTTVSLKFDENSEFMIAYMNLLIGFIQVHLLLGRFNERKMLVILYDAAFRSKMNTAEPNFLRLATYIQEYDNTIRHLQDVLAPNASRVGETLMNLVQTYQRCNSVHALRKEGALSLIAVPDKLTLPIQDHFRFELVFLAKFYLWIVYGFLFCPKGIKVECLDLLKVALSDGWVATIYRDEVLYVHDQFEELFGWYTIPTLKQSKGKKFVSEASAAAVQGSGEAHTQRRIYLKQELSQLYHLLSDRPGLLGPKIQVVFAALSLTKDEILWYFRHNANPAPKSKGKYVAEQYGDYFISDLIYFTNELTSLIQKHKTLIQQYYVEYISGPDRDRVKEDYDLQQKTIAVDVTLTKLFKAIVDDLAKANLNDLREGRLIDLKPLRLNWLRCVGILSSFQSTVRIQKIKDLVTKVQFAISHSRSVDSLDQLLQEYASLRDLYYYKDHFLKLFQDYASNFPHIIMSMVNVVNSFPENATRALPDQRVLLGREATSMVADMLEKLSVRIWDGTHAIYTHFFRLQMKLSHTVIYRPAAAGGQQPAIEPAGSESYLSPKNRKDNYELQGWQSLVGRLCKTFTRVEDILVFDQALCPRLFLRSVLSTKLEEFIAKLISPDGVQMNRPSLILPHIRQMMSALKLIERHVNIDVDTLFRQVMVSQFVDKSILGPLGQANGLKSELKQEATSIHRIALFYARVIFEYSVQNPQTPTQTAIVYSTWKRTLVADAAAQFQPEEFCDQHELTALCQLIGPYGVRFVDNIILRQVQRLVGKVKEFIAGNRDGIDAFVAAGTRDQGIADALKKVRGLDTLFTYINQIGVAFFFRISLHDALQSVVSSNIPNIFRLVNDIATACPPNFGAIPELQVADFYATDCGLRSPKFDIGLRVVADNLIKNQDDRGVWEKLPSALGMLFNSTIWNSGRYMEGYEAHSRNVHCIALASYQLIVAFSSALNATHPDCLGQVTKSLADYTHLATTHLLRIRPETYPQPRLNELWAMYIFLFKFATFSKWITLDQLNAKIPYAMVRSAYLHLTTQRQSVQRPSEIVEETAEA
eukprot:TRINITY_DN292_c0_g3_i1.p1 TRINITY_DN292_c0_g3~~TRINITY_DN292_c0_g3_i1.p1  ORF type:complete len:1146 (+),score=269.41 TRINITY_DN292_c0_g3_i1:50-3487(+)